MAGNRQLALLPSSDGGGGHRWWFLPTDRLNVLQQFRKLFVDHQGQVAAIVQNHVQRLAVREVQRVCSMHQSNSSSLMPFHA